MTDDIVKRLADNIAHYQAMNQTGTLLSDAKAEIERLRTALTCVSATASRIDCGAEEAVATSLNLIEKLCEDALPQ